MHASTHKAAMPHPCYTGGTKNAKKRNFAIDKKTELQPVSFSETAKVIKSILYYSTMQLHESKKISYFLGFSRLLQEFARSLARVAFLRNMTLLAINKKAI